MSIAPIPEAAPPVMAARVILTCGFVAAIGFGLPAFGPGGDMFMKVVTILLAVGTPIVAFIAARRARRDGDAVGMKR